jgi:hypothetical protein
MSVVNTHRTDLTGFDKSLARSALDDHSSPPVGVLPVTAFTHNSEWLRFGNSTHSHSPDAVKLHFSCTFALFNGEVNPLSMGNSRIYDFKTCVEFLLCDEFIQFVSQVRVRWGLVEDVKGVPRHVKQPPCAFRICPTIRRSTNELALAVASSPERTPSARSMSAIACFRQLSGKSLWDNRPRCSTGSNPLHCGGASF